MPLGIGYSQNRRRLGSQAASQPRLAQQRLGQQNMSSLLSGPRGQQMRPQFGVSGAPSTYEMPAAAAHRTAQGTTAQYAAGVNYADQQLGQGGYTQGSSGRVQLGTAGPLADRGPNTSVLGSGISTTLSGLGGDVVAGNRMQQPSLDLRMDRQQTTRGLLGQRQARQQQARLGVPGPVPGQAGTPGATRLGERDQLRNQILDAELVSDQPVATLGDAQGVAQQQAQQLVAQWVRGDRSQEEVVAKAAEMEGEMPAGVSLSEIVGRLVQQEVQRRHERQQAREAFKYNLYGNMTPGMHVQ